MIKAKKSLGQNFLRSKTAIDTMIKAGNISSSDTVLEIGPGKGAITGKLLEYAGKVIAIEKDKELIILLQEKFTESIKEGKLILAEDDAGTMDISSYTKGPYKIVANIPYYITGLLLRKFLSEKHQPSHIVFLVQKEVADRIVARDKKESILSLSVKAYGTPAYITKVQKRFFSPEPRVDSAIISISNISKLHFKDGKEEERFFDIVKVGFAHKRKVLRKNLEGVSSMENITKAFTECGIPEKARAEDLSFGTWLSLSRVLSLKK